MKGKEGEHSDQSNKVEIAKATGPDNQRVIRNIGEGECRGLVA